MAEAIALSAVEKIGGCLIEPLQRELGYLFCFNNNIQELETRLGQLKDTTNDVQAREDEAKRSFKTLGDATNKWMVDASEKIEEADNVFVEKAELLKGCFSVKWCPNLKLRFSLGRKSKKLSLVLDELLQRGAKLPQTFVALPMPPMSILHDNDDHTDFGSRRKDMEKIIEMLRDKETRLIGICGMPGIGKTSFVNQVLQKVRDLFDFQFILIVSGNPNFSTIQLKALKKLGFNLSPKEIVDEKETALRLLSAFDKKNVLVVLDDVWEEFDLNALGFPLKQSDVESCCKIIYTSRTQGLWLSQGTIKKKEIHLQELGNKESLDLFIREANLNNDDDDFQKKNDIARKIVNECKGLPLALKVAGSALIQKRVYEWDNMLSSFRKHHQHQHIDKIKEVLEKSYDFLEDVNLKHLFLLCCLFREDQEIPIETLCRYAEGLQLFKGINGLKDVRNRVYTLVDDLIRRNLLINVEALDHQKHAVKMHDVVRDVGISIGEKHENGFSFLVCNDVNNLKNDIGKHTKIVSIFFKNRNQKVLDMNECRGSKLELLRLESRDYLNITIQDKFFEMMGSLKVLVIVCNVFPKSSYSSSFSCLSKLKMLCLENLDLECNLSTIRHLSSLEILSLQWSTMKVLPNEIRELTNLRLLDLTGCKCFISKGVLSKLTNLQNLCMWNSFLDWRVPKEQSPQSTTDENYNGAAELSELNHLNKLWRLELEVSNIEQVQRGVTLLSSSNLLEYFKIRIGGGENFSTNNEFESGDRQLLLENIKGNFLDELGNIMKNKITNLYLYKSSIIWENMHLKEFLKDIVLEQCESIITLFPHSHPRHTFNELGLRSIKLYECNQMRHLFLISIIRHLKNLQVLNIKKCEKIEEVVNFYEDKEEHKIIEFNSLETLKLDSLCRLECFCKGVKEIHFSKLKILELKGLEQFIFPEKLEILCLKELVIESIPNLKSLCNFCAPSLKELKIYNCEDFTYVFSSTSVMKENISHLSKLYIQGCRRLKGIIFVLTSSEEEWNKSFSFPNLQKLRLEVLDELASFVIKENEEEKMQRTLFYHDQVTFPCLQEMKIDGLPKINYIVGWNEECNNKEIQQRRFPNLKVLFLASLMELVSFSGVVNNRMEDNGERRNALFHSQVSFSCLKVLLIHNLPKINYIVGWTERLHHSDPRDIEESYSEIQPLLFPDLKKLTLNSLMELVSFVEVVNCNVEDNGEKQNALFHPQVLFPCLIDLRIFYLPKINYIVGWNGLQHDGANDNERKLNVLLSLFPSLKYSCLEGLSNLIHIYENNHPELEVLLFQNLCEFKIRGCENLRYLFSENMGRDATKNLEILDISYCPLMEVVMKNDDDSNGGGRESIYVPNNHFFPLLENLKLKYLPELKRFCDVDYTWTLPLLKELDVQSCPKLEALSPGCLNSPKLETLTYNCRRENAAGDTNNALRNSYREHGDGHD